MYSILDLCIYILFIIFTMMFLLIIILFKRQINEEKIYYNINLPIDYEIELSHIYSSYAGEYLSYGEIYELNKENIMIAGDKV